MCAGVSQRATSKGWMACGIFATVLVVGNTLLVRTAFSWSTGGPFSESYYSTDVLDTDNGNLTSNTAKHHGFVLGRDKLARGLNLLVDPSTWLSNHAIAISQYPFTQSTPLTWCTGPSNPMGPNINFPAVFTGVSMQHSVALLEIINASPAPYALQLFDHITGKQVGLPVSLASMWSGTAGDQVLVPFDLSSCKGNTTVLVLGVGKEQSGECVAV
jgi:hypothetical protein